MDLPVGLSVRVLAAAFANHIGWQRYSEHYSLSISIVPTDRRVHARTIGQTDGQTDKHAGKLGAIRLRPSELEGAASVRLI